MLKKTLYLLLAVSLGINAGLLAMTLLNRPHAEPPSRHQPPGGPGGPPPGQHPGSAPDPQRMSGELATRLSKHLDLDEQQQRAVREILERHAPRLIELQRLSQDADERLTEAYATPDFDPETFRRLVAETSAARSAVDSLSAVILLDKAAVFTPEQRARFTEAAPVLGSNPVQATPPRGRDNRPPPRR